MIESLEDRRLMSASLVGTLASGKPLTAPLPPGVTLPTGVTGGKLISTLAKNKLPTGENTVSVLAQAPKAPVVTPPPVV